MGIKLMFMKEPCISIGSAAIQVCFRLVAINHGLEFMDVVCVPIKLLSRAEYRSCWIAKQNRKQQNNRQKGRRSGVGGGEKRESVPVYNPKING